MMWKPNRLTKAQLEERRKAAMAMYNDPENTNSQKQIAEIFGVSRIAVYYWMQRERTGSIGAVKQPGRPRTLKEEQEQELLELIKQPPTAYGYKRIGWTTQIMADLIEKRFGVKYSADHTGKVLRRLEMSVQKPVTRGIKRFESF